MEMKVENLYFFMLEKEPQAKEKSKEVFLYNEMLSAIEKIRVYMTGGVSAENLELTKVTIKEDGMKAEVVAWSTIAEALLKKAPKA
jgi:hypothetical protein